MQLSAFQIYWLTKETLHTFLANGSNRNVEIWYLLYSIKRIIATMLFANSIIVVFDWCFMRWRHLLKQYLMPLSYHVTDSDAKCLSSILSWVMIKKNTKSLHWILPTCLHGNLKFKPIMAFSNFALRYHKDIDHWVIYHLKDVCEMCRRSLNHFSWINIVPCSGVVYVNVNFDTWIAWQTQMCGWLFLWQNVRIVNLSITHDYLVPSLSFNVSRSSGNSNSILASVTSNFGLGSRQFGGIAAQSLRFLQNMILRVIYVD